MVVCFGMCNEQTGVIHFLGTGFQDLSNFSAHEVEIDGVVFKTVEHAYQALRVVPGARKKIMEATSPIRAWQEGQACKERNELLLDYNKDELMEKILRAKLVQHEDVRELLLSSGERELVKNTETDSYWGNGKDGLGQNKMGKLWMRLRTELQTGV